MSDSAGEPGDAAREDGALGDAALAHGALGEDAGVGDDALVGTVTWDELHREAVGRLRRAGVASAEAEARWVVEESSGYDGADFHVGLAERATVRGVARFDAMLVRRESGEPLQYVLGHWSFRTLDLFVDRRVLIPRPETEGMVDVALRELDCLRSTQAAEGDDQGQVVVDLGTGSGAIALSVAVERSHARVWATDRSSEALAVARANAAGLGRAGTRVRLVEGDWYRALPAELRGGVDLVVSNPPYIADGEDLPVEVAGWEPAGALRSGPSGLEAVEAVVAGAATWLAQHGAVVVELAPHQAAEASVMAARHFDEVTVEPDLSGRPRTLVARR